MMSQEAISDGVANQTKGKKAKKRPRETSGDGGEDDFGLDE